MKISDFRILSGWFEKYKSALSKSDFSWDNSYSVRLVIVSSAVNIGFDNEQDLLNLLIFLNNKHPNIKLTIEKQINHSIPFLDLFISGINNQNLTLHKSTYTGLV